MTIVKECYEESVSCIASPLSELGVLDQKEKDSLSNGFVVKMFWILPTVFIFNSISRRVVRGQRDHTKL